MVPVTVVELTVQFVAYEGSQIAASSNEKRYLVETVFLGEPLQERYRKSGLAGAEDVDSTSDFDSAPIAASNYVFSPSSSICFSSIAICDGRAVDGPL